MATARRSPLFARVRSLVLPLALCLAVASVACGSTASRMATASTPAGPPADAPASTAVPGAATPAERDPRGPVVVLDPGHAVDEAGASAYGVVEKDSNLDMARRVAALLRAQGVTPILTRDADVRAAAPGEEPTTRTGYNGTRLDLQARIDLANAAHADALVSLHSNGAADPGVRGYEVYYNAARPFADQNRALAARLLDGVTAELRAAGLPTMARGVIDDACLKEFQGRCFPLFILGPPRITDRDEIARRGGTPDGLGLPAGQPALVGRASAMPGALVELLFISSPEDAALLLNDAARDAMARGVARGILDFLRQQGRLSTGGTR